MIIIADLRMHCNRKFEMWEDMAAIAALDKKKSSFFLHTDPNMVEWFVKMVQERKKQHDCTRTGKTGNR